MDYLSTLTDKELQQYRDQARFVLQCTGTLIAKRNLQKEEQKRASIYKDKETASMHNDLCKLLESLPEFRQLAFLANLLTYSRKKGSGDSIKLECMIDSILKPYNLDNNPTVLAHLIRVGK